MKYLFINTVAGFGSTGRIVEQTCRELMAQGHECRIAYGRYENLCPDIPSFRIGSHLDNLCNVALARALDRNGFGTKEPTKKLLSWVKEYDPDVIWLHNLHGYYLHVGLLFDYLRTSGKEIRWTLHDCWAFTGGCTYFDFVGCDRWKTGCYDCPQKKVYPETYANRRDTIYQWKKQAFSGIPNVQLTVPSHWLAKRVKQSFLKEYPVEVVYNRVASTVFRPNPGNFRQKYGLQGKTVLLGVASMWEPRKGLADFAALAPMLPPQYQIVLIGLTPKAIQSLPAQILGLPRTDSVEELVNAYSSADLYISASTEETFGMTVLEAALCGTPVLVYTDTACQEIAEQYGGVAVPRGAEHLRDAILGMEGAKK